MPSCRWPVTIPENKDLVSFLARILSICSPQDTPNHEVPKDSCFLLRFSGSWFVTLLPTPASLLSQFRPTQRRNFSSDPLRVAICLFYSTVHEMFTALWPNLMFNNCSKCSPAVHFAIQSASICNSCQQSQMCDLLSSQLADTDTRRVSRVFLRMCSVKWCSAGISPL